jgi:hypothetical protein
MRRNLIVGTVLALALGVGTVPAVADTAQPRVVSEHPVPYTPQVQNGSVDALALVGHTVVVGGDFTEVADAAERSYFSRRSLFAYDLTTGVITAFAPQLDGAVAALAAGPNGTVYVGGNFHHVDGVYQAGVTQLDVGTGARVGTFRASTDNGDVRTLGYRTGRLYVGGTFTRIDGLVRVALARVDGTTGALDPGFDLQLAAPDFRTTKVVSLALNPAGSRLVALGVIESANGYRRAQLAVADTGTGRVADWYADAYDNNYCYSGFDTYLRAVDFSPAGDYFVVVSTGRYSAPDRMCDTAARFDLAGTGLHRPAWVNHTGGNTLLSVDVTGPAVYVGGHQEWLDNPYGQKSAGPGAVVRPGVGAIDPVGGRALAWNPTHSRGVGVSALLSTPAGLVVGSDTTQMGHEYHARLGMFAL